MEDWGSQPMRARTEEWKCLWPLLAGHRGSCRLRRANRRQLEMLTNEDADGVVEEPLAVTSRMIEGAVYCGMPTIDDWGSQPMKARTEDWKMQCLWPLLAGHSGSCRLWRANHVRLEKPTNDGADGRLEVGKYYQAEAKICRYDKIFRIAWEVEGFQVGNRLTRFTQFLVPNGDWSASRIGCIQPQYSMPLIRNVNAGSTTQVQCAISKRNCYYQEDVRV
nr:unnamed protein product [Spirometra erinaceieuropaei]